MKTAELKGKALNFAVHVAEGWVYIPPTVEQWPHFIHSVRKTATGLPHLYVEDQAGDDIIDREKIATQYDPRIEEWVATAWLVNSEHAHLAKGPTSMSICTGATRREAAMRAWVGLRLGMEVDIPEEFQ